MATSNLKAAKVSTVAGPIAAGPLPHKHLALPLAVLFVGPEVGMGKILNLTTYPALPPQISQGDLI